ncbi:hypothetical protein [Fulvimarina sp. MAC8]|uniref:hypothetical protein n=1 Tax=Fulvimarina sp. MAC8 TaxID=3162874 RepID=UPI0032ED18E8
MKHGYWLSLVFVMLTGSGGALAQSGEAVSFRVAASEAGTQAVIALQNGSQWVFPNRMPNSPEERISVFVEEGGMRIGDRLYRQSDLTLDDFALLLPEFPRGMNHFPIGAPLAPNPVLRLASQYPDVFERKIFFFMDDRLGLRDMRILLPVGASLIQIRWEEIWINSQRTLDDELFVVVRLLTPVGGAIDLSDVLLPTDVIETCAIASKSRTADAIRNHLDCLANLDPDNDSDGDDLANTGREGHPAGAGGGGTAVDISRPPTLDELVNLILQCIERRALCPDFLDGYATAEFFESAGAQTKRSFAEAVARRHLETKG